MTAGTILFIVLFTYPVIQGILCLYGESRDTVKRNLKSRKNS